MLNDVCWYTWHIFMAPCKHIQVILQEANNLFLRLGAQTYPYLGYLCRISFDQLYHLQFLCNFWLLLLRNTYLGPSFFASEEAGYRRCSPTFGVTSWGTWMTFPWTVLLWWFLFPQWHFVDEEACDPRPSESFHVDPCYHPWTCWNPPFSRISVVSHFV